MNKEEMLKQCKAVQRRNVDVVKTHVFGILAADLLEAQATGRPLKYDAWLRTVNKRMLAFGHEALEKLAGEYNLTGMDIRLKDPAKLEQELLSSANAEGANHG